MPRTGAGNGPRDDRVRPRFGLRRAGDGVASFTTLGNIYSPRRAGRRAPRRSCRQIVPAHVLHHDGDRAFRGVPAAWRRGATEMIRRLKSGDYRLYSRKKDPRTGRRRNLGTFATLEAAKRHERAVQFFKRH